MWTYYIFIAVAILPLPPPISKLVECNILLMQILKLRASLNLRLLFPKSCLLFYFALFQKRASPWYLHFLLISGGFGAFTMYSRLVLGVFFYRLRQLPIAKYSYAESILPFLTLNYCARLVPRRCLDWEQVAGRKMFPIILDARACLLFTKLCRNNRHRPRQVARLFLSFLWVLRMCSGISQIDHASSSYRPRLLVR